MGSLLREYVSKKLSDLGISEELNLDETIESLVQVGKICRSIGAAPVLYREVNYLGTVRATGERVVVSQPHSNFFSDGLLSNAEVDSREKERKKMLKQVLNNLSEPEDE